MDLSFSFKTPYMTYESKAYWRIKPVEKTAKNKEKAPDEVDIEAKKD